MFANLNTGPANGWQRYQAFGHAALKVGTHCEEEVDYLATHTQSCQWSEVVAITDMQHADMIDILWGEHMLRPQCCLIWPPPSRQKHPDGIHVLVLLQVCAVGHTAQVNGVLHKWHMYSWQPLRLLGLTWFGAKSAGIINHYRLPIWAWGHQCEQQNESMITRRTLI